MLRIFPLAIIFFLILCPSFAKNFPESKQEKFETSFRPLVKVEGLPDYSTVSERMSFYHTPGMSIAVIHDGRIVWAKGYGVLQTGRKSAVNESTVFEAASISKPVTTIAAMMLVQKNLLDLDSGIYRWLHNWHAPRSEVSQIPPTIRQIMSHTAGFNVESVSGYSSQNLPGLRDIMNGVGGAKTPALRVIWKPGEAFHYSGGGLDVLQQIINDVGSSSFENQVSEMLFKPLQMTHSTFYQPPIPNLAKNEAKGHQWNGSLMTGYLYPEMAAAGLRTTPSDLAKIILEIQRAIEGKGHVLSPKSAEEILTLQNASAPIGLGFFLSGKGAGKRFFHDGWNNGFTCRMVGFVGQKDGAVVMTNSDSGGLMFEALDAIARAYNWPDQNWKQLEAKQIPEGIINRFPGKYEWGPGLQADIIKLNSRLFLQLTRTESEEMEPFPPTELFAKSVHDFFSAMPFMNFRFNLNKAQEVEAMEREEDGKQIRMPRLISQNLNSNKSIH
ncbi:MAG: beta-lactamase family protein [Candidatus Riflebacteria bacterium]|nr:beta-lactamase family protein [Candidatus Riflebacteria bacterium]